MIYVNPQLLTEIVLRVKLKLKFLSICCKYLVGCFYSSKLDFLEIIEIRFIENHRNSISLRWSPQTAATCLHWSRSRWVTLSED